MAAQFNGLGTERRGALRYAWPVARSVFAYRPAHYAIECDGERTQVRAGLLGVVEHEIRPLRQTPLPRLRERGTTIFPREFY